MNRSTAIMQLLGVDHPIIQAPMAGVSTPELAAAVSNAGALGSLGLGAASVTGAQKAIQTVRTFTDRPFNVNFFCHESARADAAVNRAWLAHLAPCFKEQGAVAPDALHEIYTTFGDNPEMIQLVADEKPPVVSFHFGIPKASIIDQIHAYGGRILISVTTLAEAGQAAAAGVDAVVAQGIEAGGHRGNFDARHDEEIGLAVLVRQIAVTLDIPIVAAGGLMDGQSIFAIQQLGAGCAQLGTAFLLCPESAASPAYRQALQSPAAQHTAVTRTISGRPARGIAGPFQNHIASNAPTVPDYPIAYDAAKHLHAAAKANSDMRYAPNWAGQGASMARALPAAELVGRLVEEIRAAQRCQSRQHDAIN